MVAGACLALAWLLAGFGAMDIGDADRFEVVDVVPAPTLTRHAVVYRHLPSGSKVALTGLWIVEGAAPDKGSRDRPAGAPVAIWSQGWVRIGWSGAELRLFGDQRRIGRDAAGLPDCAQQLCLDPARVTFVPLPR